MPRAASAATSGSVAAVGHQEVGRGQPLEQRQGLRGIVALAGGEPAAHQTAARVGHHVQLAR